MALGTLSATNLAAYHHLSCDLYIHNVRHGTPTAVAPPIGPSEISKAQFARGNDWESRLFAWLDDEGLLLRLPSKGPALDAGDLQSILEYEERDHFYIAGISIWPPKDALREKYKEVGMNPVEFGLAKPDLVEITRLQDGTLEWAVLDAKASKAVKTSHHVQIFFYTMCLEMLLPAPQFQNTGEAALWLPPKDGLENCSPSLEDVKRINISLLSDSLNEFLFQKLPKILNQPRKSVRWHLNPVCRGCPYEPECRGRATAEGTLGAMANITLDQAALLRSMLSMAHTQKSNPRELTDIEDLHRLVSNPARMLGLAKSNPSTVRKSKRILGLPLRLSSEVQAESPILNAALTEIAQVMSKRSFTMPSTEDVAVVLSLIQDPETNSIASFCLSVFSDMWFEPEAVRGSSKELVLSLATMIDTLLTLSMDDNRPPRTQFYVFSAGEHATLQRHLIDTALNSDPNDAATMNAIRTCVGALSEGAALLATAFQPVLLSGALLDFLAKKGRAKPELKMCLQRLGLSTVGTVEVLRLRIEAEVQKLKDEGGRDASDDNRKTELGQLPRVVVLKREIERLVALPVAGFWDLPECAHALLEEDPHCSSDEKIFALWKTSRATGSSSEAFDVALSTRNVAIWDVIVALREIVQPKRLLVNEARVISARFMDLCRQEHIRKLFFMQQFEILSKLTELWSSRIEGCPEAPILRCRGFDKTARPPSIMFDLMSGTLETPVDSERAFYDYILVEDNDLDTGEVPVEALFDDLGVSGLMFPLNVHTKKRWTTQSAPVRENLFVADVRSISTAGEVVLNVWSSEGLPIYKGRLYRLSPRLVDFNLTKVLSTLLELDFQAESRATTEENVPFLQLIADPRAFAVNPRILADSKSYLGQETRIQATFRELSDLDVDAAGALLLKASQHQAARRILSRRLAICFGPPGTGKTYTLALSILRLFDVQHRLGVQKQQIVFVTAMTHAAIQACLRKLNHLVSCYRSVPNLPADWLDKTLLEHVAEGGKHPKPSSNKNYIYAGTVYQLYNFSKRYSFEVDLVVIDEAGQLSLASASLVTRSLSSSGRVVIAGDSEQLAPIFSGEYPVLPSRLFGSILDCVMFLSREDQQAVASSQEHGDDTSSSASSIVQLTENFRLNPDLGDFISTIYPRTFKPQKVQARKLASRLATLALDGTRAGSAVFEDARQFLVALSSVMLRRDQTILSPPRRTESSLPFDLTAPHAISLSLIDLKTRSGGLEQAGSEDHTRGEAALAAALVALLRKSCPKDDIFVATPHRAQRQAVKDALSWDAPRSEDGRLVDAMSSLALDRPDGVDLEGVRVDTVERLQGSEASFVICLFSVSRASASTDLNFLLERRRLNVAISRAKTLCILITSEEVMRPPVSALANEGTAKGFAFLRAFEARAWSTTVEVVLDNLGEHSDSL